ncbi:uncharacterized protein LOC143354701 [Halictus rubicundus]|uniref:uncharacterized protein LOC143354701 n=1 Tax=Halictus rubicundus TaxID=77578 RepID=UPI004035CF76
MQPKPHYVTTWMWKLFSRKVWFSVLATYVIFSVCSYIFHAIEADMFGRNMMPSMLDSFFNNLSMICAQHYHSTAMSKSSKMLEYLIGLFIVFLEAAFNALVLGYMTQVIPIKQIDGVYGAIETTEYNIFAAKGSFLHLLFAVRSSKSAILNQCVA